MTESRSLTRTVAVIVVVIAFIALTVFALSARAYKAGHPAVRVPNASLGLTTPKAALPISSTTPTSGDVVGGLLAPVAAPADTAPASAPPAAPTPAPDSGVHLAACELGLPVPTEQAGLANLIAIVPLFGPFSPEAFAMVPAFTPGFPLLGPLVIAGGESLDQLPTDQLATALRPLENQGFDALSPLYGPVRPQVLEGEAQLASALQPLVATFASMPGATCLPAALSAVLG